MNLVEWLNNHVTRSRRLETVVRKYGADFISTYGAGVLAAAGALTLGTVGPFITIPAAITLVCGVNKLGHDYRENELLETYRDQIASSIPDSGNPMGHRDPASLTTSDMRDYAFGEGAMASCSNNLLRCEMEDNDRRMWTSIGLHALSGLLFGLAAGASTTLLAGLDFFASLGVGAGAMVVFQQIDKVVTEVGRTLLDVNRPSAHQGILEMADSLHKGQGVSELQVFAVLVDGNKDLREQIQKVRGIPFRDMYLDDKMTVLKEYGPMANISEITSMLNSGRMEAEDVVLALCDQPPAMKHMAIQRTRYRRLKESEQDNSFFTTDLLDVLADTEREKGGSFWRDREQRVSLSENTVGHSLN